MNYFLGKRIPFLLGIGIVVLMVAIKSSNASAGIFPPPSAKNENSFRKSNRNYSNACELLNKKRMAKGRQRKSPKLPKWR